MNIGQIQSVSSLRFHLYERPLHPELFEIYHDHHIVKEQYEAQIWVTGCTHVIGFYHAGRSLLEVTADAAAELPQRGRLVEMPFRGEKDHDYRHDGAIRYMMNFQVETMSAPVFSKTHHDLARAGTHHGLFVPFPMWMTRSPLTPFTYIDYTPKPGELHVFTFHAFPEDLTIVKTQSIFEVVP